MDASRPAHRPVLSQITRYRSSAIRLDLLLRGSIGCQPTRGVVARLTTRRPVAVGADTSANERGEGEAAAQSGGPIAQLDDDPRHLVPGHAQASSHASRNRKEPIMKIAIVGGTGLIGSKLVTAITQVSHA